MYKIRLTAVVIVAVLFIIGFLTLRAVVPSASAHHNDLTRVGMGDLRRFEAQQAQSLRASVGMGDLRHFEALQAISGRALIGMGDLRRFEAGQALSSRAAVGMGDLRLFEASQSIP
jgi:hypothetical protein